MHECMHVRVCDCMIEMKVIYLFKSQVHGRV